MKRTYRISFALLILSSLMIVLEMFDIITPPDWLSNTIGALIIASLYSVVYIRVRRSSCPGIGFLFDNCCYA